MYIALPMNHGVMNDAEKTHVAILQQLVCSFTQQIFTEGLPGIDLCSASIRIHTMKERKEVAQQY